MKNVDQNLNLRARHPDFQKFIDFNNAESERVRQQYNCLLNVAYGNHSLQALDVFPSEVPNSPILVFIHGGYWRALDKSSYSFVAEPFIKQNYSVFVINYRLIPQVSLPELVKDVESAIAWIQTQAHQYNGNPDQIILSGHSAGGHLTLMIYLLNPSLRYQIKAICSISGLFDLKPIQASYLNDILQFDESTVKTYSPIHYDLSIIQCPLLLSVGLGETPLFIKQSQGLYEQNRNNQLINYLGIKDLNHYQIIHELGRKGSELVEFILKNSREFLKNNKK